MRRRLGPARVPRWLFYFAVGASWLFGVEIVVLTAAKRSLPGRLPVVAGWAFVAATAVSVIAIARLEMTGRQQTTNLVEQLEEALSSITALTEASLSSLELSSLLDGFLERLVNVLHTEIGAIFLLSESGSEMRTIALRGPDDMDAGPLNMLISDNDGLIGRVVVTEVPIATNDQRDLSVLAEKVGRRLASAAACPILVEGRLIGVCVAATTAAVEFGDRELHLMQLVADRSGLGIERRRLDEAERRARLNAERAHRAAVVLATTSAALATARDEYRLNLAALVDVVVPAFSDWCEIDLGDGSGALERLSIRHVADKSDLCFEELRQRVPLIDVIARRAIEMGATELSPAFLAATAPYGSPTPNRTPLDVTPWIIVPINTSRGMVGTISFAFDDGMNEVDAYKIDTAEDIARRAAIAVDRVQYYQDAQQMALRSRRVANQLQQLLDASLEVSRLYSDAEVISAISLRALSVCDADSAVVTVGSDSAERLRAVAERGKPVAVGNAETAPLSIEAPADIRSIRSTLRTPQWLATPILGLSGEPDGTVAIWRQAGPDFSSEDETVLVLLAQTASTALASAALYRTIQSSEARWRTLIEAAPIGVMEVDLAGVVQWANRSATEIFGDAHPSGTNGQSHAHALVAIPSEHVAPLQALWSRAASGAEVHDREVVGVSIGGVSKDLLVSIVPLHSPDNEVQGILTLVADISDRRRLESELRQAQRLEAVGQLAGNVAHDFNNLLTLISGYTELLRGHKAMDDRQLELVTNIQGVTDRAALLTGRLLTISRRQPPRPLVLDPVAALESITEVLGKILGDRIQLECEFAPEAVRVSMDPGHFDQMILNLAVNACDAMADGGVFTITVRPRWLDVDASRISELPEGDYIEILVADNGSGMDAEAAVHCFDPFFTTKGPSKGTGLGLAAVRGVVAECGGAIGVTSELGAGTTFTIRLPAARTAPEVAPDTEALDKQASAGEVTILVAEDDDTLRTLIVKVLAQAGYRIFSAPAGDLALELAAKLTNPIDLLVTDVAMPGMNGPALAAEIERQSPGTLVLFISSNTAGIALPDSGTGTTSFLPKPFRPSQLVARVRQLLDSRTQQVNQEVSS